MPSDDSDGDAWLHDLAELDRDELIEQITVDAYGDEGYWSFRQAFEDHIKFPMTASVVGAEVSVSEVGFDGDERRGLTAAVQRDHRTWTVSLLDIEIEIDASQHRFARLVDAYRRWLGADR